MNNPTFSIIVPVFNMEKYLVDALDTIKSQVFSDFEVILVNDGSTDSSNDICNEYVTIDSRFKLINQKNQGLSVARNNGLKYSIGSFVYFFDSDDRLKNNALLNWDKTFNSTNAEAILFNAETFLDLDLIGDFDVVSNNYMRSDFFKNGTCESNIFIEDSLNNNTFFPAAWAYVTKRTALKELTFEPGILHEDNLFYIQLFLLKNIKVYIDHQAYFYRRIRNGSIMTSKITDRNFEGYLKTFNKLIIVKEPSLTLKKYIYSLHGILCGISVDIDGYPVSNKKRIILIKSLKFIDFSFKKIIMSFLPEIIIFKKLLSWFR